MLILSTALIALWVLLLKYAEIKSKDLKFHKDVISDFIPQSRQLQLGFVFLTAGLSIFAYLTQQINEHASWCFYLGAFGSLLVAATRSKYVYNTKSTSKDWLHILGAGLAFAVTTLGTLLISYKTSEFLFGLAVSIPLYSILGFAYRLEDGDKERIVAYPLILWFVINAVGYWSGSLQYTVL